MIAVDQLQTGGKLLRAEAHDPSILCRSALQSVASIYVLFLPLGVVVGFCLAHPPCSDRPIRALDLLWALPGTVRVMAFFWYLALPAIVLNTIAIVRRKRADMERRLRLKKSRAEISKLTSRRIV